ncbi:MAG: ATP-binding protein [Phycisphaerales bacterium]
MIQRSDAIEAIHRGLANNPGVALLGPRQCGKTTLARQVAQERSQLLATQKPAAQKGESQMRGAQPTQPGGVQFFDLENPSDATALDNPMLALQSLRGLVVLDEVQRKPELFPVLRVLMDRPENPAKFLLLGSASPYLVRGVTESLAGRVTFLDLQGFNLAEVNSTNGDTSPVLETNQQSLWMRGGFPRSFLAPNEVASFQWRRDFIRSFIEKDFATLGIGATPSSLGRLWQMTAHYHGQTLNASELGRSLGQTYKTIQRHVELLEGAFMVRMLRPWFENAGKRTLKNPKLYVRDSGLLHALLGVADHVGLMGHPKLGASWEGFAIEQILTRLPRTDAWFWGTQGGAELDLFVQPGGKRVGFELKFADAPKMTKSLASALKDLRLDSLIVVKPSGSDYQLSPEIKVMSLKSALLACDELMR